MQLEQINDNNNNFNKSFNNQIMAISIKKTEGGFNFIFASEAKTKLNDPMKRPNEEAFEGLNDEAENCSGDSLSSTNDSTLMISGNSIGSVADLEIEFESMTKEFKEETKGKLIYRKRKCSGNEMYLCDLLLNYNEQNCNENINNFCYNNQLSKTNSILNANISSSSSSSTTKVSCCLESKSSIIQAGQQQQEMPSLATNTNCCTKTKQKCDLKLKHYLTTINKSKNHKKHHHHQINHLNYLNYLLALLLASLSIITQSSNAIASSAISTSTNSTQQLFEANIAQQHLHHHLHQPQQIAHLLMPSSSPSSSASASSPALSNSLLLHNHQQQQQHDNQNNHRMQQHQKQHRSSFVGSHFQPAFVLGARNKAINFTHLAFDELTSTVYLGANNWLLQVGASSLRPEVALRTGPAPAGESPRDCSPADCPIQTPQRVDISQLQLHHAQGFDLSIPMTMPKLASSNRHQHSTLQQNYSLLAASHRSPATTGAANGAKSLSLGATSSGQQAQTTVPTTTSNPTTAQQQQQLINNNLNKLFVIEPESRKLIVCGSLNQGACRKHQLGQLANFSELIQMPVASNDEFASNIGAVVPSSRSGLSSSGSGPILYVAATNSRSDLYREMVPSISARYLEPEAQAMQIIERSFTETAKIDISFELRDYYLVNYVHSFQSLDHIYFATNQRKSPLRQLEEWGYISRLARLCLGDLSFQTYAEISLECRFPAGPSTKSFTTGRQQQDQHNINYNAASSTAQMLHYNLLQDAQLIQASNQLALQLGLDPSRTHSVLVGVFSQSKDHTLKSQQKSAICLFPMEQIESTFNENIASCLNGTIKTRHMNYIAGAVNDCPKTTSTTSNAGANLANTCNEPIKLNGSIPLVAQPVITFDSELLTSIGAFWAPTSPISSSPLPNSRSSSQFNQPTAGRQHQILLAGTSEGELKRIALLDPQEKPRPIAIRHQHGHHHQHQTRQQPRGHVLDSLPIGDSKSEPILADMTLLPPEQESLQSALIATPNKLVKLRVNGCRMQSAPTTNQSSLVDSCQTCAALEDPLCGWCSTAATCTSREICIQHSPASTPTQWLPFDQIRCTDYDTISPKAIALQSSGSPHVVEVNVALIASPFLAPSSSQLEQSGSQQQPSKQYSSNGQQLAWKLAQAQFQCHFDYLALANKSQLVSMVSSSSSSNAGNYQVQLHPLSSPTSATMKATQARLNLHTGTVTIGCPLPSPAQRPISQAGNDEFKVSLIVRLDPSTTTTMHAEDQLDLELALGLRRHRPKANQLPVNGVGFDTNVADQRVAQIERVLTFYDCSQLTTCFSCTNSSHSCSWCPLTGRCTFNASHSEFGCAASALMDQTSAARFSGMTTATTPSTTIVPHNNIRASHLTNSLNPSQASIFGIAIDRSSQCPVVGTLVNAQSSSSSQQQTNQATTTTSDPGQQAASSAAANKQPEILIAHQSRRSIVIPLRASVLPQVVQTAQAMKRSSGQVKVECLFELDGDSRARVAAKLVQSAPPESPSSPAIICQEMTFSYGDEIAIQRAQVQVIMNENQIVETSEVILFKCHLFGINPPALMSSLVIGGNGLQQFEHQQSSTPPLAATIRSSAAWRAHEILQLGGAGGGGGGANDNSGSDSYSSSFVQRFASDNNGGEPTTSTSDCSLCANIERKFRCQWCQNACLFADQCPLSNHHQASSCPPPRIDSIHPTSGPLEGGTLITIEGSNLGSSEREIQDKITVGGLPCHLMMYSVSTRIVCKTSPANPRQQPGSTVYVGNKAGVSSAHQMFHYKPVHLTGVTPRQGPVSGGTKLTLTGSNLNVGSRIQIFLDDIPCALESHEISSNQISCITAPNLQQMASVQISKLTLMIDNSTHYYPHPFTYQPDPIITSIEPTESFISGGRLLLISGHHLSSPQSIKLMVYQDYKHLPINGTTCMSKNDTLITCLTPAISRSLLLHGSAQPAYNHLGQSMSSSSLTSYQHHHDNNNSLLAAPIIDGGSTGSLPYSVPSANIMGGFRLRMFLMMDDVKSVRNLDDYYHHLPHFLTYYEDPRLYRLPGGLVEYSPELVIEGDFLQMNQLDQDILITIGARQACLIKSIEPKRIVCEPPAKVEAQYDLETGKLLERANLAIVGLIGSHLSYSIGHMQYTSQQYLPASASSSLFTSGAGGAFQYATTSGQPFSEPVQGGGAGILSSSSASSYQLVSTIFVSLSVISFLFGLLATIWFAMKRNRQTKYEREYKRIQLQMGSLDINGQPVVGFGAGQLNFGGAIGSGGLFSSSTNQPSTMMISSPSTSTSSSTAQQQNQLQHRQHHHYQTSTSRRFNSINNSTSNQLSLLESANRMRLRALNYIMGSNRNSSSSGSPISTRSLVFGGGSISTSTSKKLFYSPPPAAQLSNGLVCGIDGSSTLYNGGGHNGNHWKPLSNHDNLIQANNNLILSSTQKPHHHLVVSKLTPDGRIVSGTSLPQGNNSTTTTLYQNHQEEDVQHQLKHKHPYVQQHQSSANNNNNISDRITYELYSQQQHQYQAIQQPQSLVSSSGISTNTTSPLVSYSSNNYQNNNNINEINESTQMQSDATAATNSASGSGRVSITTNSSSNSTSSSQQCSPGSSTRMQISPTTNQRLRPSHQQQQQINSSSKISQGQKTNFNWTQGAPSTILPYAVIESCNLTIEGKNAIKQFV